LDIPLLVINIGFLIDARYLPATNGALLKVLQN